MDNIQQTFFSPLGKQYCMYFYIMSIIMFLSFLFLLGNVLMKLFRGKLDNSSGILQLNLLVSIFIGYFTNRLLYSMCAGSLK